MKDVAAEAGVGVMTVSRVVNGGGGVAPETAARVELAIRKLGYQRDNVARQLRSADQSSQTIGLVVDNVSDPFMGTIASAVEEVARQHHNVVLIGSSHDDKRREREVVAAFTARRVDGMILTPVTGSHRFVKPLLSQGTKIVCVDRAASGMALDTVVVDNFDAVRNAVRRLIARGHRRIGYLGDKKEIWTIGERYRGYLAALEEAGIDVDEAIVRHGLRAGPEAAAAVTDVLSTAAPPTAFLASNNVVAIGALAVLPPHIAFIGFDDFTLAGRLNPPVTVIAQDLTAIGRTAAHLLFERIHGDTSPPRTIVIPTTLITRGSGEIPGPCSQGG